MINKLDDLKNRKKVLEDHLKEFNKFRDIGDYKKAYEKMVEMLMYANDTISKCTEIVKGENADIIPKSKSGITQEHLDENQCENKNIENSETKKIPNMIVIPKKQNIH